MRQMPDQSSRRWWRLWRSGAFARDRVFFRLLAERLEEAKQTHPWYFERDDPGKVRRGERLATHTRGIHDMAAYVAQNLNLPRKVYERCTAALFGSK